MKKVYCFKVAILTLLLSQVGIAQVTLPASQNTGITETTIFGNDQIQTEAKVEVNVMQQDETSNEGGLRINVSQYMSSTVPDLPPSGPSPDGLESLEDAPYAFWVKRTIFGIPSEPSVVFSTALDGRTNVGYNAQNPSSTAMLNVAGNGRFYQQTGASFTEVTSRELLWNGPNYYRFRHMSAAGTKDLMTLHTDGKIGLGTGTETLGGDFLLYVNGKMLSEEHTVKLKVDWPDYVFEDDYEMLTLAELESFIKENKHLPEVPSAAAVTENGVELGATQAALLRHIEELTLRLIEMEKRLNQLENEND